MGRVHELCTEKGSERPEGSKDKYFKGRALLLGNQVKDEAWNGAMFAELGSAPASLIASRFADYVGLLPGNECQQADAEQAYRVNLWA